MFLKMRSNYSNSLPLSCFLFHKNTEFISRIPNELMWKGITSESESQIILVQIQAFTHSANIVVSTNLSR